MEMENSRINNYMLQRWNEEYVQFKGAFHQCINRLVNNTNGAAIYKTKLFSDINSEHQFNTLINSDLPIISTDWGEKKFAKTYAEYKNLEIFRKNALIDWHGGGSVREDA